MQKRFAFREHLEAPLFFLILAFVCSRIFYLVLLGLEFDASPLDYYWQYLDRHLLILDLWQSLRHLHSQPPLFNLLLGLVLKTFPESFPVCFQLFFLFTGFFLALATYGAMKQLGVRPWISAAITTLWISSPATVLYENWLFYSHLIAALFAIAVFLLSRYWKSGKMIYSALFVSIIAALTLTRSSFPLPWFALFLTLIFLLERQRAQRFFAAVAVPLLLLILVHANAYFTFGTIGLSESYANLSWSTLALESVPKEKRKAMLERGLISPLALVTPYSPVETYLQAMPELAMTNGGGIAALEETKKKSGIQNQNHIIYLVAGRIQKNDALKVFREYPANYFQYVELNFRRYFLPKQYSFPFNNQATKGHENLLKVLKLSQWLDGIFIPVLPVLLPITLLFGCLLAMLALRRLNLQEFLIFFFIILSTLMVSTGFIFISPDEHNRYRSEIDPGYVILFGLLCDRCFSWLIRKMPKRPKDPGTCEKNPSANKY